MRSVPGHARHLGIALTAMLFVVSCSDPAIPPSAPRLGAPRADIASQRGASQHIFMFNSAVPANFASQVAAAGGTVVRVHGEINTAVTRGLSDANALTLASTNADVVRDTAVRWTPSPSSVRGAPMSLAQQPADASARPPQTAAFLPQQWNMFQINAPEAWKHRTGIKSVRVAILDSGLDPHHVDQHGLIDEASSVAFVQSTAGPPAWQDDFFHGTFVGGIVTSNNFGTAGVAPNVTLVAVKVLDNTGSGSFGDVIAGIVYAAQADVQVINMSLGALIPKNSPGSKQLIAALKRAVDYAARNDVLVVTAAGNDGVDLQHDSNMIEVPCQTGIGLCVSATSDQDTKASYSNYGAKAIDVAAPGGDLDAPPQSFVLGLCDSRNSIGFPCAGGFSYLFAIGTSASAPHVSGLGAFLDSQFGGRLEANQIISLIQQNADKIGSEAFYGEGRINVAKTLDPDRH